MGGTLIRLINDQHDVHIAYMTSGNIAVFDHDARMVADLVSEYNRIFGIETDRSSALAEEIRSSIQNKRPGQPDTQSVLNIKGLIRKNEARAGAIAIGFAPIGLRLSAFEPQATGFWRFAFALPLIALVIKAQGGTIGRPSPMAPVFDLVR
jgi:glucosamine-6-phosphate deaminase